MSYNFIYQPSILDYYKAFAPVEQANEIQNNNFLKKYINRRKYTLFSREDWKVNQK